MEPKPEPKPNPLNPRGKFLGGRNEHAAREIDERDAEQRAPHQATIEVFAAIPQKKKKKSAKKGKR